jgi:hypothetical protein
MKHLYSLYPHQERVINMLSLLADALLLAAGMQPLRRPGDGRRNGKV